MSLELRDVTVRFGGVTAVDRASLTLERSHVLSVIGPNGSGKSTLFNSISGLVPLVEGSISIDGRELRHIEPSNRIALGLARTFQTPRFDPSSTVEHAVLCGFYPVARVGLLASMLRLPAAAREERKLLVDCHRLLGDLGLYELRHAVLGGLSMGQIRLVGVARAVANNPKYLLLDEPAAGLSRPEQHGLAEEIRRLASSGIGVLLVEHNFSLVRALAERVLVLDRGRVLLEGRPEDLERNDEFVDLYLGNAARANR